MIFLDLMILQKLLRIFILIILIRRDLNQKISLDKTAKPRQNICLKDLASKQKNNIIICSLFLTYHIFPWVIIASASCIKLCIVKLSQ